MADYSVAIDTFIDPYNYLGMTRNPEGSIVRLQEPPIFSISPYPNDSSSLVLSKDIAINQSKSTWARVFLPRETLDFSPVTKLPLLIYFHGGGFIVCRVDSAIFHHFYASITLDTPAVVVSVEYRRAPEDRLPAAYDDCMEALHWIKTSKDELFSKFTDFSRCYLMGTSSGGNIAYHVGLRAATSTVDLKPLNIRGLILHQPFFGGTTRTRSELKLVDDMVLPLCVTDLMWELSLPIGVDRDHEYSNPTAGMKSSVINEVKALGWRILITGCEGDPLIDRQMELKEKLEEMGVKVMGKFDEGGHHCVEAFDLSRAKSFYKAVKDFIMYT